jgi:hypothetical protein
LPSRSCWGSSSVIGDAVDLLNPRHRIDEPIDDVAGHGREEVPVSRVRPHVILKAVRTPEVARIGRHHDEVGRAAHRERGQRHLCLRGASVAKDWQSNVGVGRLHGARSSPVELRLERRQQDTRHELWGCARLPVPSLPARRRPAAMRSCAAPRMEGAAGVRDVEMRRGLEPRGERCVPPDPLAPAGVRWVRPSGRAQCCSQSCVNGICSAGVRWVRSSERTRRAGRGRIESAPESANWCAADCASCVPGVVCQRNPPLTRPLRLAARPVPDRTHDAVLKKAA